MAETTTRVAVLGAGSWGATLAWLFGSQNFDVRLWTRDRAKLDSLKINRRIEKPLPVSIPPSVEVFSDISACLDGCDIVLFCCTSQSLREVAGNAAQAVADRNKRPVFVSCCKGLELKTHKRMSEVIMEVAPEAAICSLSGPNLAPEILSGLPAAAVVAASNLDLARSVQESLSGTKLRLYSNQDIVGVELGGTIKNIIAIAAGASEGLKLGLNARAALLTRGLAEMTRLAVKLGADRMTLSGLAGMGDLFATCSGPISRNYKLGMELARGKSLDEALKEVGAVVEGVPTTEAVCELSKRLGLELPIADQVYSTLRGESSPEKAIMTLMKRPLASE